ncbi:MAG: MFS transporter, partial [Actinobacteria bacterium]|nr:MFS transporter [Actinomycetota bacterium]
MQSLPDASVASVSGAGSLSARLGVLRHRNFALYWFGMVLSNTGSWMQLTAEGWLVYQLTDAPIWLGAVAGARAISMIGLPFLGGVVADRMDRRILLFITQTSSMALAALLATLTATGLVQVWHILAIAALGGVAFAFDQPTRQALVPALVPRAELRKAIALNAVVYTGGAFIGPAAAGGLAPLIGVAGVFAINAGSFLAIIGALALMRLPGQATRPPRTSQSVWASSLEGLRFVRQHELILVVIGLSAVTSLLLRFHQQLAPVFARDILGADIRGLGLLMSGPGLGALIGAFAVATWSRLPPNGRLTGIAVPGLFVAVVVFAASRWFPVSLLSLVAIGLLNTVYSTSVRTMLQLSSPAEYHGRVMSLNTITFIGFTPLGGFIGGALAQGLGAPWAVAAGALAAG